MSGCVYDKQEPVKVESDNSKPIIQFFEIKVNNKTRMEVEIDSEEKATIKTLKDVVPVFQGLKDSKNKDIEAELKVYEESKDGFNVEIVPENHKIKKIRFKERDLEDIDIDIRIDDISPRNVKEKEFVSVYAIDPTKEEFKEAKVTVTAKGNTLYKCKEWDFSNQECDGEWKLFATGLIPGKEYTFTITPEDPGYGEILITKAIHLDEDRNFVSDIYNEVKSLDGVWSEEIQHNEFVRVKFEKNLTSKNDITIFPRITQGEPKIEVYEKGKTEIIAEFNSINPNQYNQVYLTNLEKSQDTFDLKVIGGKLEFDHIIDPTTVDSVSYSQFSATNHSFTHNVSGLNRLLTVSITQLSANAINSVTYAGQALTQLRIEEYKGLKVEVWYLINPATGSNLVEINKADNASTGVGVISYIEVDQTLAIDSDNGTSGDAQDVSLNVVSETGNLVQDALAVKRFYALEPGVDQILRWNQSIGGAHGTGGSTKEGASLVTMSWTRNSSDRYAMIAFDINRAIPPNISQSPSNGFVNNVNPNVTFVCNLTDNNGLSNVSLYLTNKNNQSFRLNDTKTASGTSDSISWSLNLPNGNYTWDCEAYDNRSNVAWGTNYSLKVVLPDLVPISVDFSDSQPVENEEVTIIATIENREQNVTDDFIVQFMLDNCSGTQIGTNKTVNGLVKDENVTLNVTYTAVIGPNNIYVCVDQPIASYGLVIENKEDNNLLNNTLHVTAYQYFYGDIQHNLALQKQTNETQYDWVPCNGTVYATDIDGTFSFSDLQALGRTKLGGASSNDFTESDNNLGMDGFNDSITTLWATDASTPKQTTSFIVGGKILTNVPYINSGSSGNFITGILWDTSGDSNGEYDETDKELLVFVSKIKNNESGEYGTYDYEIKVPALMRSYYVSTDQITIFLESR
jgi:hypothetical protein